MFQEFPYTDMHQLNLDWVIKIAKDFLDQYTHIQEIISQGLDQLDDKTIESINSLNDKTTELIAELNAWYTEHSGDISTELQTAITNFNAAANIKAAETIASIPEDYTTLSNLAAATNELLINLISEMLYQPVIPWEQGSIQVSTGIYFGTNTAIRSGYTFLPKNTLALIIDSGYGSRIYAYNPDDTNYVGAYNSTALNHFSTSSGEVVEGVFDMLSLPRNYNYRITLVKTDGTDVPVSDQNHIKVLTAQEADNVDIWQNLLQDTDAPVYGDGYFSSIGQLIRQDTYSGNRYAIIENVKTGTIYWYSGTGYWTTIWGFYANGTAVPIRTETDPVSEYYFIISDPNIVRIGAWSRNDDQTLILKRAGFSKMIYKEISTEQEIDNFLRKIPKTVTVSPDGTADFTSIRAAWNYINENNHAQDNWTIYIKNGEYVVTPEDNSGKSYCYFGYCKINIVGESREKTIIKLTNNTLTNKIFDIGGETLIENLSLMVFAGATYVPDSTPGYCIHIDRSAPTGLEPNKKYYTTVKNCYLYDECHSPIGAGLQDYQTIRIVDCMCISNVNIGTSAGAIYIHSSTHADADNMAVEIINTTAISKDSSDPIALPNVDQSYGSLDYTDIDVTLQHNICVPDRNAISTTTHRITAESQENNIRDMNYTNELKIMDVTVTTDASGIFNITNYVAVRRIISVQPVTTSSYWSVTLGANGYAHLFAVESGLSTPTSAVTIPIRIYYI